MPICIKQIFHHVHMASGLNDYFFVFVLPTVRSLCLCLWIEKENISLDNYFLGFAQGQFRIKVIFHDCTERVWKVYRT